jgi:hypothetical protein
MNTVHPATSEEDNSSSFYTSDFADMGTFYLGFCPTPVSPSLDPDFQSDFAQEEAKFLTGIPFNRNKYLILNDFLPSDNDSLDDHTDPLREGRSEPLVTVAQNERGWPRGTENPEYYWDCMFRRYQGRVQVAIFVYRVGFNGGEQLPYAVCHRGAPSNPDVISGVAITNPRESPLPVRVDFPSPGDRWYPEGDATPDGNPLNNLTIPGTLPSGSVLSQLDPYANGWQQAGQWLIDQNGTVHRVLSGRDNGADGPVRLTSQVPYIPVMDVNGNLNNSSPGLGVNNTARANIASAVKSVWFIPPETRNGFTLTPVYATVGEL